MRKLTLTVGSALLLAFACDSSPEAVKRGDGNESGGGANGELDADGDGVADSLGKAVDQNSDGKADSFDFHGDGKVVGPGVDTNSDGKADAIGHDTDDDGIIDALDTDGDGRPDVFVNGDDGGMSDIDVNGLGGSPPDVPVGNGKPEICDGIDNDEDGNIDNIDEGGDGICDCLNIGTIGRIGPWSSGGDIFKDWLDSRSPIPATEVADSELTKELLAGLDVIVVLRADTAALGQDSSPAHHEFSPGEVAALSDWVKAGGGLMTTIGYQGDEAAEIVNVNRLLAPFSLGYDPDHLDLGGPLAIWDETHPIANGVSNITVNNGVSPLAAGTVVARGATDGIGVVVEQIEDGRVIVFGDEWVTYDSEWEDTEGQQVELLWLNMIKWMSPPKKCQVAIPPDLIAR